MSIQPDCVYESLKDTVNETRRRKATLTELASRVPEEFFEDLKMAFNLNDRERSGKLDYETFAKCLKMSNMNAT